SGRRTCLAAAMRMVDRIHRDAANVRTFAHMPLPPRIADDLILMLEITELTDRRATNDCDLAHLARRHPYLRVLTLFCHQLRRGARGPYELPAFSRTQLDVMDDRAFRNIRERQRVAGLDVGLRP